MSGTESQEKPEGEFPVEMPERQLALPFWVPILIGLTLVALAAMAVYTGLRTQVKPAGREVSTLPAMDTSWRLPDDAGGPPGAPEPGGSRVVSAHELPEPGPIVDEKLPRYSIAGDAGGVSGLVRFAVRRGIVFDVEPRDAVIYVNDTAVGEVQQFESSDQVYEFAEQGTFTVRVVAPGYVEAEFIVTAADDARDEVAEITTSLASAG